MSLIKDIVVAIWVAILAAFYFIFLFFMGIGILLWSEVKEFFKKRAC